MSAAGDTESGTETPPSDRLTGPRLVVHALDHRAQLAALEVAEAWSRLVHFGLLSLIGLGLLHLAVVAALAALVAATWDTSWRVAAPALAALILAIGGSGLWWYVRQRSRAWEPFRDLFQQLASDVRSLRNLINTHGPSRAGEEERPPGETDEQKP